MTEATPVSVVITTQGRPRSLRRCLTALAQQDHPLFEVVVVGDMETRTVLADMGLSRDVKNMTFARPNISMGRNIGIAAAAGEVVAFIDDDAVPEPTWLTRLAAAFADERAVAATGFVRGRNGISFQHQASWTDRLGRSHRLDADEEAPTLHQSEPGAAVKTEGTNMAFRRAVLADMGGFDPAFRFYLDETDLNMRQAEGEQIVAVVPLAQVHHGFESSSRRRRDRVPLTLYEIGASAAVFLRKHADPDTHAPRLAEVAQEQRRRLLRHMMTGALEPRDVGRLMRTLMEGIEDGRRRTLRELKPIGEPQSRFLPFPSAGPRPGRSVAGWSWQRGRLRRSARAHLGAGAIVTMFRFSPTALYHRTWFEDEGYWVQTGGIWGRSIRSQPLFRWVRMLPRLRDEHARLAPLRPIDSMLG